MELPPTLHVEEHGEVAVVRLSLNPTPNAAIVAGMDDEPAATPPSPTCSRSKSERKL